MRVLCAQSTGISHWRGHTQTSLTSIYLAEKVVGGCILCIICIYISGIGVVPKGRAPGEWWLITDQSHTPSTSVNGGMDLKLCSLEYNSIDKVAMAAQQSGRALILQS